MIFDSSVLEKPKNGMIHFQKWKIELFSHTASQYGNNLSRHMNKTKIHLHAYILMFSETDNKFLDKFSVTIYTITGVEQFFLYTDHPPTSLRSHHLQNLKKKQFFHIIIERK